MKISLFFKSYIIKASYLFLLIYILAGAPSRADASFLDSVSSFIFGSGAQASEAEDIDNNSDDFGTDDFLNSQNMPVLETDSVNPNTKNLNNTSSLNILEDGTLSPDSGVYGSGIESISSGEMTVYEVKEGDTLSEIAEQFDVSVNTIKWENDITTNSIKVGQKLNILPVTGVKHIVKKGDTVAKVALKYDADSEDIFVFNDISKSEGLKQGDIIYIPNGVIKPVVVKPVVKKGNFIVPSPSGSSSNAEPGYYIRPANGPTTSPYGSRKRGFHYGIDIGSSRGTPVVASASGVVVSTLSSCKEGRSSCGGRYGNYILIQHPNGTSTRYAHLQKVSVSVGDQVGKGENIGTIGNTGRSTGPHLHFQIEKANGSTMRPTF